MSGPAAAAAVAASRVRCHLPGSTETRYETSDAGELAALAAALATSPGLGATCVCAGTIIFDLDGAVEPRRITLHHGESLRWDHSCGNHPLAAPDAMMTWLSRHGMGFVREQYDAAQARADDGEKIAARWREAMPRAWQPFFDEMRRGGSALPPAWTSALAAELPDPVHRARALLVLFGSGAGPWSGYPSWESVPARVLLDVPLSVLVDALGDTADLRCVSGALRLFASWDFRGRLPQLAAGLPAGRRERLIAHAEAIEDDGQRAQALDALGAT